MDGGRENVGESLLSLLFSHRGPFQYVHHCRPVHAGVATSVARPQPITSRHSKLGDVREVRPPRQNGSLILLSLEMRNEKESEEMNINGRPTDVSHTDAPRHHHP